MADVVERSLDASVSPAWILSGHSDDQVDDDLHDPRPASGSTRMRPLLGYELPVPSKDRVGGDKRRDFGKSPSPDRLAPHRESSALPVGQTKSLAPELLFEDTVLYYREAA
jgi:hypothetical protein